MNGTGKDGQIGAVAVPRYDLIDKRGKTRGKFNTASGAADYAKMLWPDQDQDEFGSGKGLDVQEAGLE